jgi:hypothetical protein
MSKSCNNIDKISWEYFCEEFNRFMDMMGTKGYTTQQRMDGFRGFCLVALRCDDSRVNSTLNVAKINYEYRMKHLI